MRNLRVSVASHTEIFVYCPVIGRAGRLFRLENWADPRDVQDLAKRPISQRSLCRQSQSGRIATTIGIPANDILD